jgi:hypothetical protein
MTKTASASDVQRDFGAFHDEALVEPIRVTKYGRETVYIVAAKTFHELKQAQRRSLAAADLSEAELAAIEAAEIPAEHRHSLADLK